MENTKRTREEIEENIRAINEDLKVARIMYEHRPNQEALKHRIEREENTIKTLEEELNGMA